MDTPSGTVLVQMSNSMPAGVLLSATQMVLSARTTSTFDADTAHRGALNHAVTAAALPGRDRSAARASALETTYQIRLSVPPTDAVTIALSTPDATTVTVEPSTIVFAAASASAAARSRLRCWSGSTAAAVPMPTPRTGG